MGATNQEIKVTIKSVIQGLKDVLQYADALNKINDAQTKGGSQKGFAAGSSPNDVKQLAAAIQQLAQNSKNLDDSKVGRFTSAIRTLSSVVQGLASANEALKFIRSLGGASSSIADKLQKVPQVMSAVSQKARTLLSDTKAAASEGLSALKDKAGGLAEKLPSLEGGLGRLSPKLLGVGVGGAAVAATLAAVLVGVIALVGAFKLLEVGVSAAQTGLERIFQRGVEYNKQLETTRLGIAAVIASVAQIQAKGGGVPLTGVEKLNVSLELAQEQLEKLKVDAINTTATFGQIAPAFLAALGPGLSAGLKLDEVRGIVVKITQAAGAIGLPFDQLNQEVRALLEGTVFNHKTHVDLLRDTFDVKHIRLTGGGSSSEIWSQMFADALNETVEVTGARETGALGAALCAGVGIGVYDSLNDATENVVRKFRIHEPDARNSKRLVEAYETYMSLVNALEPLWPRLG